MNKITENDIELFAIEKLEKLGYNCQVSQGCLRNLV